MPVCYPRILPLGDLGVTVEFGDRIDPCLHDRVLSFASRVRAQRFPGLIEIVPTYRAVTLYLDPRRTNWSALSERLLALARKPPRAANTRRRTVTIPVCYGGSRGPDLSKVAQHAGLTEGEVVALYSGVSYRVYMLGFSPGFPYMGTVPERIAMPRLPTPRTEVPAGSVGIAGPQTGIYPQATPGGWLLIGRTPAKLYDPFRSEPFLLEPGDEVRFTSIDEREFSRLTEAG